MEKPKIIIAVIKNVSNKNVIVMDDSDSNISDSRLAYSSQFYVKMNSTSEIFVPYILSNSKGKVYFFVFDQDTAFKMMKSKEIEGISKRTFLKRYMVDKEALEKVDTIVYDGQ